MSNDNNAQKYNRLSTPGVKGNQTFANKPVNDAPEGTIKTPPATPARDRLRALTASESSVEQAKLAAVPDALREILREDAPDAISATFTFDWDRGRPKLYFQAGWPAAGTDEELEEVDIEFEAVAELNEFANNFTDIEFARRSGLFIYESTDDGDVFRIVVNETKPEITAWAAVTAHIRSVSDEAGFSGIMPAVYSIIQDREEVSGAGFHAVNAGAVTGSYAYAIAPAIAEIEKWIQDLDAIPGVTDATARIAAEAEKAGCASVMPPLFELIRDYDNVSAGQLAAVTADDMDYLYDVFVGPAIDKVNNQMTRADEADPGVQAFLRDEFANHATILRDATRSRDEDEDEDDDADDRLTWGEAADSLIQMPDEILIEVTGTTDPAALRDRVATIANRRGFDTAIDN